MSIILDIFHFLGLLALCFGAVIGIVEIDYRITKKIEKNNN